MVEIRSLSRDESEPRGDAWVMIEKKDERYFMTARAIGNAVDANVSPSGFESPKVAIRAAASWADLLVARVIYVRDGVSVEIWSRRGKARC
jgi:hypothetical protein